MKKITSWLVAATCCLIAPLVGEELVIDPIDLDWALPAGIDPGYSHFGTRIVGKQVGHNGGGRLVAISEKHWRAGASVIVYELQSTSNWTSHELSPVEFPETTGFGRGSAVGLVDGLRSVVVGASEKVWFFQKIGGQWVSQVIDPPASATVGSNFGSSVALATTYQSNPGGDTDWLFVGADNDDGAGEQAGAVFVYKRVGGGWTHHSTLAPSGAGALFGANLSIGEFHTSDTAQLVVSAPGFDQGGVVDAGKIHVFEFHDPSGGWVWATELTREDPEAYGWLGRLALSCAYGRIAASGGPYQNRSVSIFDEDVDDGWSETRLNPENPGDLDNFGVRLSLGHEILVIGELTYDRLGTKGRVRVYGEDAGGNWVQKEIIDNPVPTPGNQSDLFGSASTLVGNDLLIGAQAYDGGFLDSGRVFQYQLSFHDEAFLDVEAEENTLSPPGAGEFLGYQLIRGLGAEFASIRRTPQGKELVSIRRVRGTGDPEGTVIPASPDAISEFGDVIAAGLSHYFVSSGRAAPSWHSSGRVHVYKRDWSTGEYDEAPYLQAPNPAPFQRFGASIVPIPTPTRSGDRSYVAIGAPGAGNGKVFLYQQDLDAVFEPLNDWYLIGELVHPAGQIGQFGDHMYLARDGLVPFLVVTGSYGGAQEKSLFLYDSPHQDETDFDFREIITPDVSGVVQALGDRDIAYASGYFAVNARIDNQYRVLVLRSTESGWATQVIAPTEESSTFGASIEFFAGKLIISNSNAPSDRTVRQGYCEVYELEGTTWEFSTTIDNPDPSDRGVGASGIDAFGISMVSLGSSELLVGAPGAIVDGQNAAGKIYSFVPGNGVVSSVSGDVLDLLSTPGKSRSVWSDYSSRDWNEDAWFAQYDLTGVAWNQLHAGTLITPEHVISADHVGSLPPMIFTDANGVDHVRHVTGARFSVQLDVRISRLNAPVPPSVKVYALPESRPGLYRKFFAGGKRSGVLALSTSWTGEAGGGSRYGFPSRPMFHDWSRFYSNGPSQVALGEGDFHLSERIEPDYLWTSMPSDSGHPTFLPTVSGDLALLTDYFGSGGGPDLSNRANQIFIEKMIRSLGASDPDNLAIRIEPVANILIED